MHVGKYYSMFSMTDMFYSLECVMIHPQNLQIAHTKEKIRLKGQI